MEKRIFGFDIGIASLGWAVVDFDDAADPENNIYPTGKIVKSGVRCFPVAENPKDGSSLAQPRRQKRVVAHRHKFQFSVKLVLQGASFI